MKKENKFFDEDNFEENLFHQMFHLVQSVDKLKNETLSLLKKTVDLEGEIYDLQKQIKKYWHKKNI